MHLGLICHQQTHLSFHGRIAEKDTLLDIEFLDQSPRRAIFADLK
jgi:hypothetical protein